MATTSTILELEPAFAQAVAETMQALATPSRLRILGRLHSGPSSVEPAGGRGWDGVLGRVASASGSAAPGARRGSPRRAGVIVYELHDDHVGQLLEQAIGHVEHLRLGPRPAARFASRRFKEA